MNSLGNPGSRVGQPLPALPPGPCAEGILVYNVQQLVSPAAALTIALVRALLSVAPGAPWAPRAPPSVMGVGGAAECDGCGGRRRV